MKARLICGFGDGGDELEGEMTPVTGVSVGTDLDNVDCSDVMLSRLSLFVQCNVRKPRQCYQTRSSSKLLEVAAGTERPRYAECVRFDASQLRWYVILTAKK